LRKPIPEPVIGIIKSVMGFRQFLLRGLDRVQGEWSLEPDFCTSWMVASAVAIRRGAVALSA